jgi:2-dehydro-3-deoxy-D-arabinonate dehydratase
MIELFKTKDKIIAGYKDRYYETSFTNWDELINKKNLYKFLLSVVNEIPANHDEAWLKKQELLAPVGAQEVWAAGVTYLRSKTARMEESKESGGATFYDKVYDAERPELFFKAFPQKVVGHLQKVRIRKDSTWNVPEPELTLVINNEGDIVAYTIGNDMSSRSIEGENPLYLPQAKVYDGSASVGPCILVTENPVSPGTAIEMKIERDNQTVFEGNTTISQMKRAHKELVEFLFRENSFASGAYLMTGTCIVPDNDFTLASGDVISISITGIGTLINTVA